MTQSQRMWVIWAMLKPPGLRLKNLQEQKVIGASLKNPFARVLLWLVKVFRIYPLSESRIRNQIEMLRHLASKDLWTKSKLTSKRFALLIPRIKKQYHNQKRSPSQMIQRRIYPADSLRVQSRMKSNRESIKEQMKQSERRKMLSGRCKKSQKAGASSHRLALRQCSMMWR